MYIYILECGKRKKRSNKGKIETQRKKKHENKCKKKRYPNKLINKFNINNKHKIKRKIKK